MGIVAGYALYFWRKIEFEKKLSIHKLHDVIVKYRRQSAWHLSRMDATCNTKLQYLYIAAGRRNVRHPRIRWIWNKCELHISRGKW
jgi:hypothetical protein